MYTHYQQPIYYIFQKVCVLCSLSSRRVRLHKHVNDDMLCRVSVLMIILILRASKHRQL